MATAAGNNLGPPPPILSLNSPLHPQSPLAPIVQSTSSPTSSAGVIHVGGVNISGTNGANGFRESQAPNPGDLSGIFSVVLNRQQHQQNHPLTHHHVRWPSFSMGNRTFWTKYCLLCTVCGSAATILAGIFLVVAALFRYYTTSIYYFETVPTYIPAILLSICGVSTIAFSCKRNRNIILLRITACWSLCSAALSSVITITTSLIHMNRLQTLKECVYTKNPPSCTCYSHSFGMQGPAGPETTHYLFENVRDCDVIHSNLYACLRVVFAISVVAVLLSIFLCMLLYQLIGHERKKAYWSRIRRINSDWSADFIACLARPMPRERSSMLPLIMPGAGTMPLQLPHSIWGPPPTYAEATDGAYVSDDRPSRNRPGQSSGLCGSTIQPTHSFAGVSSSGFFNNRSSASFAFHHPPPRRLRLVHSNADGLPLCPHPFSPTITSVDPSSIFKQHSLVTQQNSNHNNHHQINHGPNPSSNCGISHNHEVGVESSNDISSTNGSTANVGRINFRSLSQSQVLQCSTAGDDDDCCMSQSCHGNPHHRHHKLPQSSSFHTNPSGRNSEFSITSLSMPASSLVDDDVDFSTINNNCQVEESGCSEQELSLTSNCTASGEGTRLRTGGGSLGGGFNCGAPITSSSSTTGAAGLSAAADGKKSAYSSQPITASEPKIMNVNMNNSFNTGQVDSSSAINSDTDIILNKKTLEFWGSLKKHKNFTYYGGGSSTSRRRRKDKNKSSLSKINSLPCSPFLNMRRKFFGTGGKSLECFQNLNFSYNNAAPVELVKMSSSSSRTNQIQMNKNNVTSEDVHNEAYEWNRVKEKRSSSVTTFGTETTNLDQRRYSSTRTTPKKTAKEIFTRLSNEEEVNNLSGSVAEVRPELT